MKIEDWMEQFIRAVRDTFGSRIVFLGLQGSHARGEATGHSDIDVVVILDQVSYQDLTDYDRAISALPERENICGFLSGASELRNWDSADRFQFYYDTIPFFGSLDTIFPVPGTEDAKRAMHTGACAIYHGCVHNALHEKSAGILQALYKSAVFVLQAKHFCESGTYIRKRTDLLTALSYEDRDILDSVMTADFQDAFSPLSARLMQWSGELVRSNPCGK